MRSDYLNDDELRLVLYALKPENSIVCQTMLATGLRIGDCLKLTRGQILQQRFTIRESKTGKSKRVYIPKDLQRAILSQNEGCLAAFPSPQYDRRRKGLPRTRQAVYMDIKRVCKGFSFRFKGVAASPHSMRKINAVREYAKLDGDLEALRKKFNHDSTAVTMIYALADHLRQNKPKKK